jgi:hypothetical protein
VGGRKEGNLVAAPAAALRPSAERCALCAGWFMARLKPCPFEGSVGERVEGVGGVEGLGVFRLRLG